MIAIIFTIICAAICLPSIFYFKWSVQKDALIRTSVIWLLVTSPIFIAILLSDRSTIGNKFSAFFSNESIYVYCVSFIAPLLTIGIMKIVDIQRENFEFEQLKKLKIFPGYLWCATLGVVLLGLTALAYSSSQTDSQTFQKTVLHAITLGNGLLIYIISIVLWYISQLHENAGDYDFVGQNRSSESAASEEFSERISNK